MPTIKFNLTIDEPSLSSDMAKLIEKAATVTQRAMLFISDEAGKRAPAESFSLENERQFLPVVVTTNEVTTGFVMGHNVAKDYAEFQHEILEIGEHPGLSWSIPKDERQYTIPPDYVNAKGKPRRGPQGSPIYRLQALSVLKDRAQKRKGVRVGGKFLDRAVDETQNELQEFLNGAF